MFTSEQLTEGSVYTREYLRQKFSIKDATLNTGIFQPSGYQSIWLFVTENKPKDSTQYKDLLHEDTLDWDGQTKGRKDQLIIDHEIKGLEILVFYRANKRAFPHGGFKYEGQFRYESRTGSRPAHFILQRVASKPITTINGAEPSGNEDVREVDKSYSYLTDKHEYNIKRGKSSTLMEQKRQLKLVYCYARKDKALRNELDNYLSALKRLYQVVSWSDHEISPGTEWEKEIDARLNTADIILLLVSSDFMASEYCYGIEMKRAIERHERGEAKVIPVILRPIGWQDTPIGKLQALPRNGKPIVSRSWYKRDYALHDVEEGLKEVIKSTIIYLAPLNAPVHATSSLLKTENGQDPITFKDKEQEDAYCKWVLAHADDGLIVLKEGRQWKLHRATCHHIIDYINKGKSLLANPKICSTSRPKLDEEARKQGRTISTGCYCQR